MLSIRQPTKTAILEVVKLQSKTKSLLKSWGVFLFSNVLKTAVLWLFFLRWSSGRLQPWARWIKEALLNFDKNQDQDLNSYSVFTFCRDQGANIISRRQFFPSEIEENQGESPFSAIFSFKSWGQMVFAPQSQHFFQDRGKNAPRLDLDLSWLVCVNVSSNNYYKVNWSSIVAQQIECRTTNLRGFCPDCRLISPMPGRLK